ncbi:hypothetical protein AB205_0156560 [Aquarana catesbeiana]|uniref:Uncharacterized protein n=1 Tax=Aquarana catesbeiana TaxID=8400 RepID=A0A2G9Q1K1_AQUCT|nr:hypothetical protein AB205_0156560 [Aquarana catesbeiana]
MVSMSAPLLDQMISIKLHTETIGPFTFTYAMSAAWCPPLGVPVSVFSPSAPVPYSGCCRPFGGAAMETLVSFIDTSYPHPPLISEQ